GRNANASATEEAIARYRRTAAIDPPARVTGATSTVTPRARDGAKNTAGTPRVTCDRYTDSSHDGARCSENSVSCAARNPAATSPRSRRASLRSFRHMVESLLAPHHVPRQTERIARRPRGRPVRSRRTRLGPEVEHVA